jgi:formylglycine-generating enzyme required for sulfatase activity
VGDVGDEVLADATSPEDIDVTSPRRPLFCTVSIPEQVYGPVGSCGRMEADEPVTGCWFEFDGQPTASMLCDREQSRCTSPIVACASGWCHVPAVSFLAGRSPDLELAMPQRELDLAAAPPSTKRTEHAFYVQDAEVSLRSFEQVMGYSPSLPLLCRAREKQECPVPFGGIFEAMDYANRLGAQMGLPPCYELTGCGPKVLTSYDGQASLTIQSCESSRFVGLECKGLRLPTRAEAELFTRAGTPYCFATGPVAETGFGSIPCRPGGSGAKMAWYCDNAVRFPEPLDPSRPNDISALVPQPSRGLLANPFGLYDAQGNLAEPIQKVSCTPDARCDATGFPDHEGDFDFDIVAGQVPYATTYYRWSAAATCASIQLGLPEHYNGYKLQVLGLRLVRTDLGDCESLEVPIDSLP